MLEHGESGLVVAGERIIAAGLAALETQAAGKIGSGREAPAGKSQRGDAAGLQLVLENGFDFFQDTETQRQQQKPTPGGGAQESRAQQQLVAEGVRIARFVPEGPAEEPGIAHECCG